jgi:hypothetical protein
MKATGLKLATIPASNRTPGRAASENTVSDINAERITFGNIIFDTNINGITVLA